jgi:hypothetical protein
MPKGITKKQRDVIDDLFAGETNEQQILKKHKVDRRLYNKWLNCENFVAEFERRLQSARHQSDLIIARFASIAAVKLVQLTDSTNSETARKACLDIINLLRPDSEPKPAEQVESEQMPELPPELATRLLAALASDKEEEIRSA